MRSWYAADRELDEGVQGRKIRQRVAGAGQLSGRAGEDAVDRHLQLISGERTRSRWDRDNVVRHVAGREGDAELRSDASSQVIGQHGSVAQCVEQDQAVA